MYRMPKPISELMHALIRSSSFSQLHESTEPLLTNLFQADHVALCRMSPELPTGFEWKALTTGHFLQSYYKWFPEDFVFQRLSSEPNTAMSDTEMLRGGRLEDTETFRRSRESDLRLRHVLAVLLAPPQQMTSGAVALYSDRLKPFPVEKRRLLQDLTPCLTAAFQNVTRFGGLSVHIEMLEGLLRQEGVQAIVMDVQGREIFRTGTVTGLIEAWFPSSSDRRVSGLPLVWRERLTALMKRGGIPDSSRDVLRLDGGLRALTVNFARLPIEGHELYVVRMKESVLTPEAWRSQLSPKLFEVAIRVARGMSNEAIALDLVKSEYTVKTQLKDVFRKLKVSNRKELIARALRS